MRNDDPSHQSPLGKTTPYVSTYTPGLLYPIDRQIKRNELGLTGPSLPFTGLDIWNAYELSWLDPRGKPVVAMADFRFPADSPRLIESKSFKLYLNSFNQTRFADHQAVWERLQTDLSAAAGADISGQLLPLDTACSQGFWQPQGILLDTLEIDCDAYQPAPGLLTIGNRGVVEETLFSHLLKSNCLVTGQPDWATVIIRYRGPQIDPANLLRYLVSFRNHNEFHEQCVERIFCDIRSRCLPEALSVYARYTRRGGLDINPFRSTGEYACPGNLREIRQ